MIFSRFVFLVYIPFLNICLFSIYIHSLLSFVSLIKYDGIVCIIISLSPNYESIISIMWYSYYYRYYHCFYSAHFCTRVHLPCCFCFSCLHFFHSFCIPFCFLLFCFFLIRPYSSVSALLLHYSYSPSFSRCFPSPVFSLIPNT
jgi:hypothetical protein